MRFSYQGAASDVNNFHFRPGRYLEEYNELAREHNQFVATDATLTPAPWKSLATNDQCEGPRFVCVYAILVGHGFSRDINPAFSNRL
jgi:hypothetical protein